MLCPVCNVELKISDRQGVEIDYCPKCRGVWLDRGELDKLIERSVQNEPVYRKREEITDEYDIIDDDDRYKRKNDPYRRDDDEYYRRKKKKSFLGEMFDIFD